MAQKIELPGTGQSITPTDPAGTLKTLGLVAVGFGLTAGAARVGISMWNRVAENTPNQFETIEVI